MKKTVFEWVKQLNPFYDQTFHFFIHLYSANSGDRVIIYGSPMHPEEDIMYTYIEYKGKNYSVDQLYEDDAEKAWPEFAEPVWVLDVEKSKNTLTSIKRAFDRVKSAYDLAKSLFDG